MTKICYTLFIKIKNKTMQKENSCCGAWTNPWTWLKILGIIAICAIVIVAILRDRIVNQPNWQINVTGEARIAYQPDIANINLGIQIDKAVRADLALNQLNEKNEKIVKAVEATGISKNDIQTQNYSLNAQYDYIDNTSIVTGYNANQTITVKVRNITEQQDLISKVIAEASKAGINRVDGIYFEASNINALKQEARLKAIADGRKNAKMISQALDVKLGDIVGSWDNWLSGQNSNSAYYGKGGMDMGSASPVIPVGSQELILEVNLSYRVK